ncbi:hypothetical protein [Maize yellow stripe virus]|nr:hypothetical protein [Maize yellow stripe virus]
MRFLTEAVTVPLAVMNLFNFMNEVSSPKYHPPEFVAICNNYGFVDTPLSNSMLQAVKNDDFTKHVLYNNVISSLKTQIINDPNNADKLIGVDLDSVLQFLDQCHKLSSLKPTKTGLDWVVPNRESSLSPGK